MVFGPLIIVGPLPCGTRCNVDAAGRGVVILGFIPLVISGVVLERVQETVNHGVLNGTSLYSRKQTHIRTHAHRVEQHGLQRRSKWLKS